MKVTILDNLIDATVTEKIVSYEYIRQRYESSNKNLNLPLEMNGGLFQMMENKTV